MRYVLQISFNGSRYHGWQKQPNAHSVQAEVEQALSTLLRQPCEVTGCGRTDAGVHARDFHLHFDHSEVLDDQLVYRLNKLLPGDIAAGHIRQVSDFFHSRFDASARTYRYYMHSRKDPFLTGTSWYYPYELDLDMMNSLSAMLLQHEDFRCFSKSNTQVHTYQCRLMEAGWQQEAHQCIFTIKANRFLRNMVRAVVGTMLEAGRGELSAEGFRQVLQSGDRSMAGQSVPAHALYLCEVNYDPAMFLLSRKSVKLE